MSIQSELLAIKGNKEFLIVEEAHEWAKAHPESDLYNALEWNDKVAGRHHRFWQLRRLIALHITTEEGERTMISLQIDRQRDGGGYRDRDQILADKSLHEMMLEDCLRELERIRMKYEKLKALQPVWQEVDKARRRHGGRKGKGGEQRATA